MERREGFTKRMEQPLPWQAAREVESCTGIENKWYPVLCTATKRNPMAIFLTVHGNMRLGTIRYLDLAFLCWRLGTPVIRLPSQTKQWEILLPISAYFWVVCKYLRQSSALGICWYCQQASSLERKVKMLEANWHFSADLWSGPWWWQKTGLGLQTRKSPVQSARITVVG